MRHGSIVGHVRDRTTQHRVANLRVEAWDKDLLVDDLVGSAVTDQQGHFEITFDESHFRELFLDRKPDLYFKVFSGDHLIASTEDSVLWNVESPEEPVVIEVDLPPEDATWSLTGRVVKVDRAPLPDILVRAFHVRLRDEAGLGEAETDATGRFRIETSNVPGTIDLRLRVFDADGQEIAATPVQHGYDLAGTNPLEVLVASEKARPDPESTKAATAVEQLLTEAQLSMADLEGDEILYVARKTGLTPEQVTRLVQSAKLARRTGIRLEVFYALFRGGVPMALPGILAQDPDVLRGVLKEAGRENVIPTLDDDALDGVIAGLRDRTALEALRDGDVKGRGSLGRLLEAGGVSKEVQEAFLGRYVKHEGSPEDFWQGLREDPELGQNGTVDRLQLSLQLGALTQNHGPLVEVLVNEDQVADLRDLSSWSVDDFADRIERAGLPEFVPGDTLDERVRAYATKLARIVEEAYPTAVLAHRIDEDDFEGAGEVGHFLRSHPDFDFRTTTIRRYLADRDDASDAPVSELERMERLFPLAPEHERYEALKVLLADGIGSARQISEMGSAFTLRYTGTLDERTARALRDRADQRFATALTVLSRFGQGFNRIRPYAVPNDLAEGSFALIHSELGEGTADLETLFGSLDFCACSHCRSVYSPAAYLVDLLAFLKNHPARMWDADRDGSFDPTQDRDLLDVLYESVVPTEEGDEERSRRPDIGGIELTCENTNTVLPYIDLVNEVLENAVAPLGFEVAGGGHGADLRAGTLSIAMRDTFRDAGFPLTEGAVLEQSERPDGPWRIRDRGWRFLIRAVGRALHVQPQPQTGGTADELRALPEHVHAKAYDDLRDAVYPRELPFDPFVEELRAWLDHLGLPRHRLMEVLHPGDPWTDTAVAAEYFGLTPLEWRIVAREETREAYEFWGSSEDLWPGELRVVETLLQRAGLSYEELLELLGTRFVDPDGSIVLDPTCSLDGLEIKADDVDDATLAAALGRLHRFIRLRDAIDLSIFEMDRAIAALADAGASGEAELDGAFLLRLSHLLRLREELDIPLIELLSWYAPIDRRPGEGDRPSFYDRLFQDRTVLDPEDPAFDTLRRIGRGETPAGVSITDHADALQAALRVSAADLRALRHALLSGGDAALDLESLSVFHRNVLAARVLQLSVPGWLTVRGLTGIDPFDVGDTADTLRFVDAVREIQDGPFSVVELDDLLRHVRSPHSPVTPDDERAASVLEQLRAGLQAIRAEHTVVPDPTGQVTARKLRLLRPLLDGERRALDADEIERLLLVVGGDSDAPPADQESDVDRYLSDFLDTAEARMKLVRPESLPVSERLEGTAARFAYVLEPLVDYLHHQEGEQLVRQTLSDALDLGRATTDVLLDEFSEPDSGDPALSVFLASSLFGREDAVTVEDLSAPEIAPAHRTFVLLGKVAALLDRLDIPAEHVAWVLARGPDPGWLDLRTLPVEAPLTEPDAAVREEWRERFTGWRRVASIFSLERLLPAGAPSLPDLLNRADESSVTDPGVLLEALAERTGWSLEDLTFLAGPDGFDLRFPAQYRDPETYARLTQGMEVVRRIGWSAPGVWSWTGEPAASEPAAARARAVRHAVKAHYEAKRWLEIAAGIQDGLRERKRDALVAFLSAYREEFHDTEDIYAHYLIDSEMSACMMTSRIKQAISSVQLFVQRCMLNLELEATLASGAVRQWEWMRQYRVWEANRKVFLYPENWIEPELRDDKSPFFVELENKLLQNEVRGDVVEEALLTYLEQLDTVARLEISGLYHQVERDESDNVTLDVLHVFGRTRNSPHRYFYRRWVDRTRWTPWEPVDLDIHGDHLVPVIWNRRLYLFWPIFAEKPMEDQPIPESPTGRVRVRRPSTSDTSEESVGRTTGGGLTESASSSSSDGEDDRLPRKHWEIQLAWSELKQGRWLPKKVSEESIKTVDTTELPAKHWFLFKVKDNASGSLRIRCLHDQDGEELLDFVGDFTWDDCSGQVVATSVTDGNPRWRAGLPGTRVDRSRHVEKPNRPFILRIAETTSSGAVLTDTERSPTILSRTPGTYSVSVPAQHQPFFAQSPFFYEDDDRTFCVDPREYYQLQMGSDRLSVDVIDQVRNGYYGDFSDLFESPASFFGGTEESGSTDETGSGGYIPPGEPTGAWGGSAVGGVIVATGESTASGASSTVVDGLTDPGTEPGAANLLPGPSWLGKLFRFHTFYHPFVCTFIRHLNRYGVTGLLDPQPDGEEPRLRRQQIRNDDFVFESERYYDPTSVVGRPYPIEDVDFEYSGAYSLYNWELFFHAPLLIATRLCREQRFDEARRWFHFIFDPTATDTPLPGEDDVPARFWKIRRFYELPRGRSIQELLLILSDRDADREARRAIEQQVQEWRDDPFNPHLVARMRPRAYQLTTVMKYCDCLISWADQLFRRDSIESINEATQLYVLAASILGERPVQLPAREVPVMTFEELEPDLDAFSNALVRIENLLPGSATARTGTDGAGAPPQLSLYFCVPQNERLLAYWDTVADRLFKIRHCMNIEGVVRELPLFEPPIDPGLLVRARAAGVDLSSALSALDVAMPHYRFNVLAQKATELCGEVRALGGALLSALEKRDAEGLALLRSGHEIAVLNQVTSIRRQQLEEAEAAKGGLQVARSAAEARRDYYLELLDGEISDPETGEVEASAEGKLLPSEEQERDKLAESHVWQETAQINDILAGVIPLIGDFDIGTSGWAATPVAKWRWGGMNLAAAAQGVSRKLGFLATMAGNESTRASVKSRFIRRAEEWKQQAKLASREVAQIDKQIAAAEIRRAIARDELDNHLRQIERAESVDAYMREKFTNEQLYDWMISQLQAVHFQSYQLAYDLARRAEQAYQHELALPEQTFIQFGYWDSLKKGLLAGERLHHDLKRMEAAYLENHRREYELTKHVSLRMVDPVALLRLREEGECFVRIPEALFDLDYPGHYLRRIKGVSLTMPCVSGPYTSVSCTLSLVGHETRTRPLPEEAVVENVGLAQSIATSGAQNDSGLFEFNFRDERYLPFEGAGAISRWRLQLPTSFRQFDYDTISDVVFHVRYTAREGGGVARERVSAGLERALNELVLEEGERSGLFHVFSAKRDFPSEWHRFLHPSDASAEMQTLHLDLAKERFPFMFRDAAIQVDSLRLLLKTDGAVATGLEVGLRDRPERDLPFGPYLDQSGSPVDDIAQLEISGISLEVPVVLSIDVEEDGIPGSLGHPVVVDEVEHRRLDPALLEDLVVICEYSIS